MFSRCPWRRCPHERAIFVSSPECSQVLIDLMLPERSSVLGPQRSIAIGSGDPLVFRSQLVAV